MMLVDPDQRPGGPRPNGAGRPAMVTVAAGAPRLPPVRRFSDATQENVRAMFEGGAESISAIARAHGVSPSIIGNWARKYHWMRPAGAPARSGSREPFDFGGRRQKLVARLYRALGRQLAGIETRARDADADGDSDSAGAEKDARQLGLIAKTLATLTALDRDDGGRSPEPETIDRAEAEAGLAADIERWARGGT